MALLTATYRSPTLSYSLLLESGWLLQFFLKMTSAALFIGWRPLETTEKKVLLKKGSVSP